MSDFTLPEPASRKTVLTWTRPYIVVSNDDQTITIHKSTSTQQEYSVDEKYAFEPESEEVFRIVATSPMQFGNARLDVLDEHSEPKGSDYLARVGQRTLVGFRCAKHDGLSEKSGRDVFFIYRATITLP